MLKKERKEKLLNRAELKGKPELHYNDMQVRRALKKYLDDSGDALLILNTLPDDMLTSLLKDIPKHVLLFQIDNLYLINARILRLLNTRQITKDMFLSGEVSDDELKRAMTVYYDCSDTLDAFGPYGDLGEVIYLFRGYMRDRKFKDLIYPRLGEDEKKIFDRLRAIILEEE